LCDDIFVFDNIDWCKVIKVGDKLRTAGDGKSVTQVAANRRFFTTGKVVGHGDNGVRVQEL
jgi:hypothetical protein